MDWIFWMGLGLGALIGLPISIMANLWTDRVRDYLDQRRTIRLSKQMSKELSTYVYVRSLREGDPTSKAIFDIDTSQPGHMFTLHTSCLVMAGFFVFLADQSKLEAYRAPLAGMALLLIFLSLVSLASGFLLYREYQQIRRKLRRFEEYENSIREEWGPYPIEEFMAEHGNPP